jgi:hypothetical protein
VNPLNNTKTDNTQKTPVEPIALLDCGKASEVTKGVPFVIFYEAASPPFDRALVW